MKKSLLLLASLILLFATSSCKSNMRRDAKRLSHKTEQCFSKVDINDPNNSENVEFEECYEELQELMDQYDKKYKNPEQSAKFAKIFLEELQKSDVPNEFKELYNYLYSLGEEEDDFFDDDILFDDQDDQNDQDDQDDQDTTNLKIDNVA